MTTRRDLRRRADAASTTSRSRALLVVGWGVAGVTITFVQAIMRLGARAVATMRSGLSPMEWLILTVVALLFIYGEGVRGIQGRFAPVVARRVRALLSSRNALHDLLAPLYLLSLIGAPPRTLLRAWIGVAAIIVAVLLVRAMPEPWRGIIDFGVAAALAWGLAAILYRVGIQRTGGGAGA